MTQRGALGPQDVKALRRAAERAEGADADYRKVALAMVEKSSYREVARLTGLSTATLQRWKREAGQ